MVRLHQGILVEPQLLWLDHPLKRFQELCESAAEIRRAAQPVYERNHIQVGWERLPCSHTLAAAQTFGHKGAVGRTERNQHQLRRTTQLFDAAPPLAFWGSLQASPATQRSARHNLVLCPHNKAFCGSKPKKKQTIKNKKNSMVCKALYVSRR